MKRTLPKNVLKIFAAFMAAVLLVAVTASFSACGDNRAIITLMDGDKVIDTILATDEGRIDPDSISDDIYKKAGYDFDNWYRDADLRNKFDIERDNVWGVSKLYCGWISLEYIVTLDLNGGEYAEAIPDGDEDASVSGKDDDTDDGIITPEKDENGMYTLKALSGDVLRIIEPTREHYEFDGWMCRNQQNIQTMVIDGEPFEWAQDVTYIAVWEANRSRITYRANGGTILDLEGKEISTGTVTQYVPYDSKFTPYGARRRGYTFLGWFDANNVPLTEREIWQTEENYTVTASYSANSYKATFILEGGGTISTNVTYDKTYDFMNRQSAPSGYVFDCWEYTHNGVTDTIPSTGIWTIDGDVSLTPLYKARDYKLTLIAEDSEFASLTVAYGSKVELPENPVAPNGYVFAGWFDNANGTGTRLLPNDYWRWSGDKHFYARFVAVSDAVSFSVDYYLEHLDHRTDAPTSEKYYNSDGGYFAYGTVGENISIDISGFDTKFEHYKFDTENPLNTDRSVTLTESGADLNFYFDRNTVTYAFYDGTGTVDVHTYRIGQSVDLSGITSRVGYELTGWAIGDTDVVIAADSTDYKAAVADTVMRARWSLKTYEVYIDGNFAFNIEYNASVTDENKEAMKIPDTADDLFDGLRLDGNRYYSLDDIANMTIWLTDGGVKSSNGNYRLDFTSVWSARKAYYTVQVWLENEDGTFSLSEDESFEKRANIGTHLIYNNSITRLTVDGTEYLFDAENENNALEITVVADNSAVVKLYYKRSI